MVALGYCWKWFGMILQTSFRVFRCFWKSDAAESSGEFESASEANRRSSGCGCWSLTSKLQRRDWQKRVETFLRAHREVLGEPSRSRNQCTSMGALLHGHKARV